MHFNDDLKRCPCAFSAGKGVQNEGGGRDRRWLYRVGRQGRGAVGAGPMRPCRGWFNHAGSPSLPPGPLLFECS